MTATISAVDVRAGTGAGASVQTSSMQLSGGSHCAVSMHAPPSGTGVAVGVTVLVAVAVPVAVAVEVPAAVEVAVPVTVAVAVVVGVGLLQNPDPVCWAQKLPPQLSARPVQFATSSKQLP
jgi:hypothetical protein